MESTSASSSAEKRCSSAPRYSVHCAKVRGPASTEVTRRLLSTQLSANCPALMPRCSACAFNCCAMIMAQQLKAHAEQRGMSAGQFALNWVLNNRLVTSVLAGPRTFAQWTEYLGALEQRFSAEDEALVDSMVKSGHPSTPGYNDPRYPVTGRPTYL